MLQLINRVKAILVTLKIDYFETTVSELPKHSLKLQVIVIINSLVVMYFMFIVVSLLLQELYLFMMMVIF